MHIQFEVIYDSIGVRDVRYIRFMFAEFQMSKMYTDLCSLIKSMMTVCTFLYLYSDICVSEIVDKLKTSEKYMCLLCIWHGIELYAVKHWG